MILLHPMFVLMLITASATPRSATSAVAELLFLL